MEMNGCAVSVGCARFKVSTATELVEGLVVLGLKAIFVLLAHCLTVWQAVRLVFRKPFSLLAFLLARLLTHY